VRTDATQITQWRGEAACADGIDLIVGHHAHVVRGVEMTPNGSLIFYGLGNFLHLGTANMTSSGVCRDYGLMARVHLRRIDGKLAVRAVEAIPVTDTHYRPRRLSGEQGAARVHALNYLAGDAGRFRQARRAACASRRRATAAGFTACRAPTRMPPHRCAVQRLPAGAADSGYIAAADRSLLQQIGAPWQSRTQDRGEKRSKVRQDRVGIGGWTYEPWRGEFYPAGLPHCPRAGYASERLTSIEINGTFYRTQSPATFAKWAKEARAIACSP
jgi:hypothetical protein